MCTRFDELWSTSGENRAGVLTHQHAGHCRASCCVCAILYVQCLLFIVLRTIGEWADEDYSIACMYAVDYRVVGGYNLSAVNFQLDLYQRHVTSGLKVNFCNSKRHTLFKYTSCFTS